MIQTIIGELPSGESVDFQTNSQLAKKLADELDGLSPKVRELGEWPKASDFSSLLNKSKLNEIILEYTGINIVFGFHEAFNMCVFPPSINRDTVISSKPLAFYKKSHDFHKHAKGESMTVNVDLKRGFVTGVEKIKTKVLISNAFFFNYDGRHIAAPLVHEIGHIISLYYSLGNAAVPNFLLTEFTERLLDTKDKEVRVKLVSGLDKKIVDLKDQNALINANSEDEARVLLIDGFTKRNRSEYGNDYYDQRTWEAMADNFVVKHGLFVELAVILRSTSATKLRFPIQLLILLLEGFTILGFITFGYNWAKGGDDYDNDIMRISVLRKQAIASLKTAGNDEQRKILKDIDRVAKLIEGDSDFFTLGEKVAQLLIPSVRRSRTNKRTQQALEHFSQSEMNVLTTRLKNL